MIVQIREKKKSWVRFKRKSFGEGSDGERKKEKKMKEKNVTGVRCR